MADMVVGKKEAIIKDPNILDKDASYAMFKGRGECLFVQRGMIFNLGGMKVADAETPKDIKWNIQQTPIGLMAMEKAGLFVNLTEVETVTEGNQLVVQCPDCPRQFKTQSALNRHSGVHKVPKGR